MTLNKRIAFKGIDLLKLVLRNFGLRCEPNQMLDTYKVLSTHTQNYTSWLKLTNLVGAIQYLYICGYESHCLVKHATLLHLTDVSN